MQNIHPLGENIIIQQIQTEEQTKGGFYIPDSAREKPNKGTVIAIPSKKLGVSVGDTVYYNQYAAEALTVHDQEYTVVHIRNIIAIEE